MAHSKCRLALVSRLAAAALIVSIGVIATACGEARVFSIRQSYDSVEVSAIAATDRWEPSDASWAVSVNVELTDIDGSLSFFIPEAIPAKSLLREKMRLGDARQRAVLDDLNSLSSATKLRLASLLRREAAAKKAVNRYEYELDDIAMELTGSLIFDEFKRSPLHSPIWRDGFVMPLSGFGAEWVLVIQEFAVKRLVTLVPATFYLWSDTAISSPFGERVSKHQEFQMGILLERIESYDKSERAIVTAIGEDAISTRNENNAPPEDDLVAIRAWHVPVIGKQK